MTRFVDIATCRKALGRFAGKKVLVVGDLMLDEHIWGNAVRVSPEAPVMVVEVESYPPDNRPGGAANVANNILALGGKAVVVGVVGDDEGGRVLLDCLAKAGADVSGVLVDKNRPTTRKTRIWASKRHQVVRVDLESRKKIGESTARRVVERIQAAAKDVDAVLLSDYDKGLMTARITQAAIEAAKSRKIVSSANPKPHNLAHFAGVSVVTLNQQEAASSTRSQIDDLTRLEKAGRKIMGLVRCEGVIITRGSKGLSVFDGSSVSSIPASSDSMNFQPTSVVHIPAVESEVYDVAGAGDTVVSALTLGLASGLDLINAAAIANCSGGAVVRKVGVAVTSVEEIARLLNSSQVD